MQRCEKKRELPPASTNELELYDRTPPASGYHRVMFCGKRFNCRTVEMMKRAEFIMQHKYGHKDFQFSLSQGSYNPNGVSQSAGTHDGGGAADIRTSMYSSHTVDDMVRSLREAGFAAWSRGRGHDSFDPHIHALAIGDRELSSAARSQVREYLAGGDGLDSTHSDPDRKLGRHVPQWAR
jgi:hypothetical protein